MSNNNAWRLDGKKAIVTGASSGMGVAIAKSLAAAGASVAVVGRDAVRLASTAEQIRAAGGTALEIIADVVDDAAPGRIVAETVAELGGIDLLVHNAGVFLMSGVDETDLDAFDAQFATHVRAPFALTQAALPHLGEGSSIVFVGSNLAHHGLAGTAAYSASKAAVEALSRTLAVELGPRGIRVNAVSPGVTRTPMTAQLTDDPGATAGVISVTPIGRLGEVEDIAAAVTYLSSDAAGFVVGTSLLVDGGQNAR